MGYSVYQEPFFYLTAEYSGVIMSVNPVPTCVNRPLIIGLGPDAESVIDYLPQRLTLPQDAGLYRSGLAGSGLTLPDLEESLSNSDAVLVIVDGADAVAREQAKYWSQRMAVAKVYCHTTLVLNSPDNPNDRAWLQALHPPYLEVFQEDGLADQLSVTFALLPLIPFLQNNLGMYDPSDLRLVLQAGTHGLTTAIKWRSNEDFASGLSKAIQRLGQEECKAALLGFNCSAGYTLDEYDAVSILISELVGEDVLQATFLLHSPDLLEGERELSITLLYC